MRASGYRLNDPTQNLTSRGSIPGVDTTSAPYFVHFWDPLPFLSLFPVSCSPTRLLTVQVSASSITGGALLSWLRIDRDLHHDHQSRCSPSQLFKTRARGTCPANNSWPPRALLPAVGSWPEFGLIGWWKTWFLPTTASMNSS